MDSATQPISSETNAESGNNNSNNGKPTREIDMLENLSDTNEEETEKDMQINLQNSNEESNNEISASESGDLSKMSNDQLREQCARKDEQIKALQQQIDSHQSNNNHLERLNEVQSGFEKKLKQQQLESSRKENILIMRLTLKEQELQECLAQIEALKQLRFPTNTQLESYLLDPALNYMFEQMKKEVDVAKARVDEMQSELNAWKFSADSHTGKRLMAKCRQLHQENEELGKMISSGKIAKLEGGLAMHKKYSEESKKSQSEIEEVLLEMEEDIEGFQNTVYYLQQQLKEQKEKNTELSESLLKFTQNDSISNNNVLPSDTNNDQQESQISI